MKKILLAITIAIFGVVAFDRVPGQEPAAYAFTGGDDKNKDRKKDPPGPPVVRDKQPKPKDPPPPRKKP